MTAIYNENVAPADRLQVASASRVVREHLLKARQGLGKLVGHAHSLGRLVVFKGVGERIRKLTETAALHGRFVLDQPLGLIDFTEPAQRNADALSASTVAEEPRGRTG